MTKQAGAAGVAPWLEEEGRRHAQRPNDETVILPGDWEADAIHAAVVAEQELLEDMADEFAPWYEAVMRQMR